MEKYKYKDRLYANSLVHLISENRFIETRESKEIEEVYAKAKLWDSIYGMTTDKAILSKIFDDEMYKLLHQTDKTDATIILEVVQLFLVRLESE